MKRIEEIRLLLEAWEHKKPLTDEQVRFDYELLIDEIGRLNYLIDKAKSLLNKNSDPTE